MTYTIKITATSLKSLGDSLRAAFYMVRYADETGGKRLQRDYRALLFGG